MVGTKINNISGESEKKLSRDAYPKSKMLELGNTKRNNPINNKNIIMAIYPVRLPKNWRHSFLHIIHIKQN
jgi:hypothetical protein